MSTVLASFENPVSMFVPSVPVADAPPRARRRIAAGAGTIALSAPLFILGILFGAIAFYAAFLDVRPASEEASPSGIVAFLGLLGAIPVALFGGLGTVFGAFCIAGKRFGAIGGGVTSALLTLLAGGTAALADLTFLENVAAWSIVAVLASVSALSFSACGQCKAQQAWSSARRNQLAPPGAARA